MSHGRARSYCCLGSRDWILLRLLQYYGSDVERNTERTWIRPRAPPSPLSLWSCNFSTLAARSLQLNNWQLPAALKCVYLSIPACELALLRGSQRGPSSGNGLGMCFWKRPRAPVHLSQDAWHKIPQVKSLFYSTSVHFSVQLWDFKLVSS